MHTQNYADVRNQKCYIHMELESENVDPDAQTHTKRGLNN